MLVQVPVDKKPGDMFTFSVPAPATQPPVMAVSQAQPVMAVGHMVPPQVAGYPPAMGQQVMAIQPVMAMAPVHVHHNVPYFSRVSTMATCIHCQHSGPTNVSYDPGCGARLSVTSGVTCAPRGGAMPGARCAVTAPGPSGIALECLVA